MTSLNKPRDRQAQALFHSLDISCSVQAFRQTECTEARERLLETLEDYFKRGWQGANSAKVRSTNLPPIYLQRQGHSVTVIGIERQQDNQVYILVFDPSRGESSSIKRLIGRDKFPMASKLLEPYRRGMKHLGKYDEFEILW
ncbi:peptidase family c78 domain-containing protein [Hirsutella rhossiliensis]